MSSFAKRLYDLLADLNFSDFERKNGLAKSTLQRLFEGSEPTRPTIVAIMRGTNCDPLWLLTGEGEAFPAARQYIPVTGLATCDMAGWYNANPIAFNVPMPKGYADVKDVFAVIAIGTSMQPDGIREGYLLFCDPKLAPNPGDAVFVKSRDGKATIKRFIKADEKELTLQGWLDPNSDGEQKPYTMVLSNDYVEMIACVVIVQRRA